nr:copia protein [Tanacetum cinerariifolium]
MFDTGILDDEEVVVEKLVVVKEVDAAQDQVSDAITTAAKDLTVDAITLAKSLEALKTSKPKIRGIAVKDKRKGKMVEPEMPLKKKDQISLDKELEFKLQAELEEEKRISREEALEANITEWDDVQAMMDADNELATSPQLDNEDLQHIDADNLKEMDLKWQMAILTMRARRFLKKTRRKVGVNGSETIGFDKTKVECYNCHKRGHYSSECRALRENKNREPVRRNVTVETIDAKALVAQDGIGYEWSDQAEDRPTNFAFMVYTSLGAYKTGLESVEARLVVCKKNEDIFEAHIKILKLDIHLRDNALTELRKKLENAEIERDEIKITLEKFENSSKTLNKMLDSQVSDKYKTGVGYHVVPPPYTGNFMPPKPDLILVDVDKYVVSESVTSVPAVATNEAKTSESKPKSVSEPLIEDWVSYSKDENETETKCKQRKPSFAKVEFVEPKEQVKSPRESIKQEEHNRQAKHPRKNSQSLRGNQSNGGTGKAKVETVPDKYYILLPSWTLDPLFSSSSKNSPGDGFKPSREEEKKDIEGLGNEESEALIIKEPGVNQEKDSVNSTNIVNIVSLTVNAASNEINAVGIKSSIELLDDPNMPDLEDTSIFEDSNEDVFGAEADLNNMETTFQIYRNKKDERGIVVRNKVMLVAQGYTQEEGIDYDEVFALVARIEATRLFLAYASFKDFVVYQMNVKSAFMYGKIEEEFYVYQPSGFKDPEFPNRVYKVENALYGLHQAPKA